MQQHWVLLLCRCNLLQLTKGGQRLSTTQSTHTKKGEKWKPPILRRHELCRKIEFPYFAIQGWPWKGKWDISFALLNGLFWGNILFQIQVQSPYVISQCMNVLRFLNWEPLYAIRRVAGLFLFHLRWWWSDVAQPAERTDSETVKSGVKTGHHLAHTCRLCVKYGTSNCRISYILCPDFNMPFFIASQMIIFSFL